MAKKLKRRIKRNDKINKEPEDKDMEHYKKSKLYKMLNKFRAKNDQNMDNKSEQNHNEKEDLNNNENAMEKNQKIKENKENTELEDKSFSSYLPQSEIEKNKKNKKELEYDEVTEIIYGSKIYECLFNNKNIKHKFSFLNYNSFIDTAFKFYLDNKKKTSIEKTFLLVNLLIENIEENKKNWILIPLSFEDYFKLHDYKNELKKYLNIYKYKKRYAKIIFNKKESLKKLFKRIGFFPSKIKEDYENLFWDIYTLPDDIKIIIYSIVLMKHTTENHGYTMWVVFSLLNSYIGNLSRFGREKYLNNCIIFNV